MRRPVFLPKAPGMAVRRFRNDYTNPGRRFVVRELVTRFSPVLCLRAPPRVSTSSSGLFGLLASAFRPLARGTSSTRGSRKSRALLRASLAGR